MGNKIEKILDTNKEKVIGKRTTCNCGCGRVLNCFFDLDADDVELVINTTFVKDEEDRWRHNFIISKMDLLNLMTDERGN